MVPALCGQQTGARVEGPLAVLGSEDGEWRVKLGGPVFLGDSVHGYRCQLAREKVEGKEAACCPLGGTSSGKCPVSFEARGPGAGKR